MINVKFLQQNYFLFIVGIIIFLTGFVLAVSVSAAGPQHVTYRGTSVKTAIPGKPFNLNLQVKNIGDTTFSNVSVILHIPAGMNHISVAPDNAVIEDNTIVWNNVPLASGQTLNPSLKLALDSGTPIKTKKTIWVEVTGDGMEATSTNFSITSVKASSVNSSPKSSIITLSPSTVDYLFTLVYSRLPSISESNYWQSRRTDKPKRLPLLGAMQFHKLFNIQH